MQPGHSGDAIPPPPPAMGQGWRDRGPSAGMRAVQQPHAAVLGDVIAPPLWAAEQPAPGRQAGSVSGRHAPASPGSPALLCPSSGWAGGPRWVGVKEKGEQCLQTPGPAAIPGWGFPRGMGAAGPALAADNAVSVPAAPYQRGGGGQTRSHPKRAMPGGCWEGVPAPFIPQSAPGRFIFARVVFFPA